MIDLCKKSRDPLRLAAFLTLTFLVLCIESYTARADEAQGSTSQETISQDEATDDEATDDEATDDEAASEDDQVSTSGKLSEGPSEAAKRIAEPTHKPESVVAASGEDEAKLDSNLEQSKLKQEVTALNTRSLATADSTKVLMQENTDELSSGDPLTEGESGTMQKSKRFLAGVALVLEKQSAVLFRARVDTGAQLCSIHANEIVIEDPAESMTENVGKKARIRLTNRNEESGWLETRIERLVQIDTSDHSENRYSIPLVLICREVEKEIQVTLNDRSKMAYPLLLGRNFLHGDFVVDIEIPDPE